MDYGFDALAVSPELERPAVGAGELAYRAQTGRTVPARSMSDAELMVLIQRGDVCAFELFYDRHVAVALRVARRVLHDHDLAEDAVQDGFVGFWSSRMTYRPHLSAAKTWLLVIVSNRAIDLCRWEHKRRHLMSEGSPLTACSARECTEEQMIAAADHQELCAQLQKLPVEQRRAIELAYFGGFTHVEIARQLGLPLGTVKGRLRLARDRLRLGIAPADAPAYDPAISRPDDGGSTSPDRRAKRMVVERER